MFMQHVAGNAEEGSCFVRRDENQLFFVVEQIQKKKSGNPILSHEG
jgi:hypothetical protein